MSVTVPSGFPLAQGTGAADISYRLPILDGSVTSLLIDAGTWSYASGARGSWAWAAAGDDFDVVDSYLGPVEFMAQQTVLGLDRTEARFRIAATNAKVTLTAESILGVVYDTLILDTGAGVTALLQGVLTGLVPGSIVYRIVAEGSDGVLEAGIRAYTLVENEISAAGLPS